MQNKTRRVTTLMRQRIESGGERLWRLDDFRDFPATAAAQTLSRMARAGKIERLSKGVYYRARSTVLGKSLPNPAAIQELAAKKSAFFPSGISAANLLGFTTQASKRAELATSALSLPRKLIGKDALIHTRRPEAWAGLSDADAALLDFLRRGGRSSELSPEETIRRTLSLFAEGRRFERLLRVAAAEPPRVRAIMGALGEQIGKPAKMQRHLRASLNPFSRFDFGVLSALPNARSWQAKEQR